MSVQQVGNDTLGRSNAIHQLLAARMIATTRAVVARVANKIAEEVVYTIREDFRHGLISRDPKDWTR